MSRSTADSGISGHCLVGLVVCFSLLDSGDARSLWHSLLKSRGRVTGRQVSSLSGYRQERQLISKCARDCFVKSQLFSTERERERGVFPKILSDINCNS